MRHIRQCPCLYIRKTILLPAAAAAKRRVVRASVAAAVAAAIAAAVSATSAATATPAATTAATAVAHHLGEARVDLLVGLAEHVDEVASLLRVSVMLAIVRSVV